MRSIIPLALWALGVALAVDARALGHSPGVWERAADPVLDANDETHRQVQGLLEQLPAAGVPSLGDYWESAQGKEQLQRALDKLEEAHADTAPDVRLRFDLGHVTYYLKDDYARSARALESALHEAPDHPLATQAYFMLGIVYAKLQQPEKEIVCYDDYLRRESVTLARSMALTNRAEAQMLLHRLQPAIADYSASLAIHPDEPLTHFGLAVALDRSGDAPGAMVEAKAAVTYDPLDQELTRIEVFFMPAYDLYFYQGLGAMARAQLVDDPATSVLWWETAVAKWMEYVATAASNDAWITLARAHQTSCERQLQAAKKKLSRLPKGKKTAR